MKKDSKQQFMFSILLAVLVAMCLISSLLCLSAYEKKNSLIQQRFNAVEMHMSRIEQLETIIKVFAGESMMQAC